jgi:hypothetical protein
MQIPIGFGGEAGVDVIEFAGTQVLFDGFVDEIG